ncbi:phosphomevalonate kinase [Niallia circulans]|uniref:phosphomevalonate kinase n=1 Tax=Niallia circulans TaxID=1397 RepID=UPI00203BF7A7|nr:phosphomevalonate kinase [Niallia circulans]MCM2982343.1 phosphomevalonate kinase [Niallia circulans]
MHEIKVPGKLFIAGEYAVLEPGYPAIVVAVDRFITAKVTFSEKQMLSLPQIGLPHVACRFEHGQVVLEDTNAKLEFIENTLAVVHQYLREKSVHTKPFSLSVTSELDDVSTGRKYGLGSSAAVVVAVVSSILALYQDQLIVTKKHIYKLAAIAHYQTQGSGSCADVAASTYGGWLHYAAFKASWLKGKLADQVSISELVEESWPYLQIEQLEAPEELVLAVGWTGSAAKTASLIKKIEPLKQQDSHIYQGFLQKSRDAVSAMVKGFKQNDLKMAMASLSANRSALLELSRETGGAIETTELEKLIQIADRYGAGKSSGAGGGDCGIAFTSINKLERLHKEWQEAGIVPLDILPAAKYNETGV